MIFGKICLHLRTIQPLLLDKFRTSEIDITLNYFDLMFDTYYRQQNLEHIPQSLFLPAHVVMERETDRQTQMERKVEDLFSNQYDPVDLKGALSLLPPVDIEGV